MPTNTALITGASRGYGFALADALATRGWRLVLDARTERDLQDAARRFGRQTEVVGLAGDITDAWHRTGLVDAAGPIDLLVNNAGALGPSPLPPLADYPVTELTRLLEVNVVAPLALIQQALPALTPGAAIVNVSSDAAREAYAGWGGYGASKAALEQLSSVLAVERPDLRVLTIDPGDMRTRMHQRAFPGEDITDRPMPRESVPRLLDLLDEHAPSGRYSVAPQGVTA